MASGSSKEALAGGKGIIDKLSYHSVEQTVEKLKNILQSKGVTLFAVVDHSGEAEKVGMKMRPTTLLIFGSPRAGTPLMLAAPSVAIDLPLKILVWEDGQGKVWVSYNSPEYLKERHGLPQEMLQNIAVVGSCTLRCLKRAGFELYLKLIARTWARTRRLVVVFFVAVADCAQRVRRDVACDGAAYGVAANACGAEVDSGEYARVGNL